MKTFHLHIKGCVQGVGFRPFVYRLAHEYGVKGWVNNSSDGVHIRFNSDELKAQNFYADCISKLPKEAKITFHQFQEVPSENFHSFEIITSEVGDSIDLAITPDFGICSDCLSELQTSSDRRFDYSFITCTNCGPRYSIMEALPYDRPETTMKDFQMCSTCQSEYDDPLDRRYFSQTNSCSECGITLSLTNAKGATWKSQSEILDNVQTALEEGEILAIKGIGGYLLVCDATNQASVQLLRSRKQRPDKPFALMYPSLEMLESEVELDLNQKELLQSAVSPILLVQSKSGSSVCQEAVAPNLQKLGVMLPYAPLMVLILQRFGKPIVATSANLSGSPIVFEDELAQKSLFQFADFVLSHNRKITAGQDDSVIQFTPKTRQKIILRRSRGLAPNFYHNLTLPKKTVLCMGAQMKGSFSLTNGKNIYVSQYLGSLGGYESQQNYEQSLRHFLHLTRSKPEKIYIDQHPQYFSSQLGQELAKQQGLDVQTVQHHKAHFGAILGEHNLIESQESILGIVWDGTGYGEDDNIWGGEFFEYENGVMRRVNHFAYFSILAGEKMAKEPRLSAFALTEGNRVLAKHFTPVEWNFYQKALPKATLQTSSIGRIFDAVASLLGLQQKMTFEGQAAILTEQLASEYFIKNNWQAVTPFAFEIAQGQISLKAMLEELIFEVVTLEDKSLLVARCYQTFVEIIREVASRGGYQHLAFSGGVFQNTVLVDLIQLQLSGEFQLYFHEQLSPNDENISFGQLVCGEILKSTNIIKNQSICA